MAGPGLGGDDFGAPYTWTGTYGGQYGTWRITPTAVGDSYSYIGDPRAPASGGGAPRDQYITDTDVDGRKTGVPGATYQENTATGAITILTRPAASGGKGTLYNRTWNGGDPLYVVGDYVVDGSGNYVPSNTWDPAGTTRSGVPGSGGTDKNAQTATIGGSLYERDPKTGQWKIAIQGAAPGGGGGGGGGGSSGPDISIRSGGFNNTTTSTNITDITPAAAAARQADIAANAAADAQTLAIKYGYESAEAEKGRQFAREMQDRADRYKSIELKQSLADQYATQVGAADPGSFARQLGALGGNLQAGLNANPEGGFLSDASLAPAAKSLQAMQELNQTWNPVTGQVSTTGGGTDTGSPTSNPWTGGTLTPSAGTPPVPPAPPAPQMEEGQVLPPGSGNLAEMFNGPFYDQFGNPITLNGGVDSSMGLLAQAARIGYDPKTGAQSNLGPFTPGAGMTTVTGQARTPNAGQQYTIPTNVAPWLGTSGAGGWNVAAQPKPVATNVSKPVDNLVQPAANGYQGPGDPVPNILDLIAGLGKSFARGTQGMEVSKGWNILGDAPGRRPDARGARPEATWIPPGTPFAVMPHEQTEDMLPQMMGAERYEDGTQDWASFGWPEQPDAGQQVSMLGQSSALQPATRPAPVVTQPAAQAPAATIAPPPPPTPTNPWLSNSPSVPATVPAPVAAPTQAAAPPPMTWRPPTIDGGPVTGGGVIGAPPPSGQPRSVPGTPGGIWNVQGQPGSVGSGTGGGISAPPLGGQPRSVPGTPGGIWNVQGQPRSVPGTPGGIWNVQGQPGSVGSGTSGGIAPPLGGVVPPASGPPPPLGNGVTPGEINPVGRPGVGGAPANWKDFLYQTPGFDATGLSDAQLWQVYQERMKARTYGWNPSDMFKFNWGAQDPITRASQEAAYQTGWNVPTGYAPWWSEQYTPRGVSRGRMTVAA